MGRKLLANSFGQRRKCLERIPVARYQSASAALNISASPETIQLRLKGLQIQSAASSPGAGLNHTSRTASAKPSTPFPRPPYAGSTGWHRRQNGSHKLPLSVGALPLPRTIRRVRSAGRYWPAEDLSVAPVPYLFRSPAVCRLRWLLP